MLYNKFENRKVNDKKVLHKVRGSWVTISTALLMAIGGGALATTASTSHAHADTTPVTATQTPQNNTTPGVSSDTQSLVNSLETPPVANKPTSASVNSASSSSASSEAYMSAESYVNGDGGSAASYHTDAYNDSVSVHNNTNIVNSYVQSVNSTYANSTNDLIANYTKAQNKENTDNTDYQNASNLANDKNGQAKVASLASSAGLTVQDYTNNVSLGNDYYNGIVKAQSNTVNQLQNVYNHAETLSSMASNPYLSAEANANLASASAGSVIANDELSASKSIYDRVQSASETNDKAVTSLSVQLDNMSTADYIATHIYGDLDYQTVSSLAKSLGYGSDTDAIDTAVSSYANNFNASTSSANFSMSIKNTSNSAVQLSNSNNNLYQLVSDTAAQFDFARNYNNLLTSLNADKANTTSYSNEVRDDSVAVSNSTSLASSASSNYTKFSNLAKFANSVASNSSAVTLGDVFNYLLSGASYSSVSADLGSINGDSLSAGLQSLSNSISDASTALSQDQTSATSYANSADVTDTLAGASAESLSAVVQSDSTATSNAKSALDNFYATKAGNDYTQASNAVATASKAYKHDNAFANAYGIHEYNYAPKHIVALKNCLLHTSTNYGNDSVIADVEAGYEFNVLGVGFSSNGTLRYLVSDGEGDRGFITANPKYTASLYLQYTPEQLKQPVAPMLDISVDSDTHVYKSAQFSSKTVVKPLHAGATVKGQIVYENDNLNSNNPVYGGFTRIKLANGDYVTANTNYVHVLSTSNVQPSEPTPRAKQNQNGNSVVQFS